MKGWKVETIEGYRYRRRKNSEPLPPENTNIPATIRTSRSVLGFLCRGISVSSIAFCWITPIVVWFLLWTSLNSDLSLEASISLQDFQIENGKSDLAASPSLDLEHEWYQRYMEDFQYCSKNNYVVDRYARGKNIQKHVPSAHAARFFSLHPMAFQRQHPSDCTTVEQILQAIQNGSRRWVNETIHNLSLEDQQSFVTKEKHISFFVPDRCNIRLLDGRNTCSILQKFSHVAFLGDSLQRQVYQGFVSSIQPDFQRGWVRLAKSNVMKQNCFCDGQYSEHMECRRHDIDQMYHNLHMLASSDHCGKYTDAHIATTYMHEVMAPKTLYSGFNNLKHFDCTRENDESNKKDLLLVLEGGLWFQSQAIPTFEKVRTFLKYPNILECAKKRKLLVIWCSYNYNSPLVHSKYPHQSPANGTLFNEQMELMFQKMSLNLTIINWMNMTKAAQVSDGLHFLTDVNHFKAQQILVLAEAMQREGVYYCDKEEDETCK